MRTRYTTTVFIILIFICGCHNRRSSPETDSESTPVIVSRAAETINSKTISLSGNIEGNKTVRLGFMVAGRIDMIAADEGEKVLKGMLLASLDPSSYAIAKELADIQAEQVQDEFDRLSRMHDSSSISESDFAKISFGLRQAKAQQKLHAKNLSDTRLYSPMDGVLLKKLAEAGEITGAGIPFLVVSDIKKVKVSVFVPENELKLIRIGQSAGISVPSLDKEVKGRIVEVGSAADPASRAFQLKIEAINPGLLLRPGMIAEVRIPVNEETSFLVIPVKSIRHDFDEQNYVFIFDSLQNKAYRRNITTGQLTGDNIEITSGLVKNEYVITGGQQKLVNGSPVTVVK